MNDIFTVFISIVLVLMCIMVAVIFIGSISTYEEVKQIREDMEYYEALNNERWKDLDHRVEILEGKYGKTD